MNDKKLEDEKKVVTTKNVFTIGFPFSHVTVEDSELTIELARVVASLARALAHGERKEELEEIAKRADAIGPLVKEAFMN